MTPHFTRLVPLAALLMLGSCAHLSHNATGSKVDLLHSRLLKLDTHLDTPIHFTREGWSFGDRHDPATEVAQLDIPRMADGNLDGGFFVVYTAQGPLTPEGYAEARKFALQRSDEIDAMVARFGDRVGAACTLADAVTLKQAGKLVAYKSMENSYPMGESIAAMAQFQRAGVRMAGPVHALNNQFADSATDKPRWNGLSPLGREWTAEMNHLGMVIDASHASDATLDQMLELSRAPIVLSHSGPRAMWEHPRNIGDERIRKLAANGGAICFSTVFLGEMHMGPERTRLFSRLGKIGTLRPAEQAELSARWTAMNKDAPMWSTTFAQYMKALLHTIAVAGVDHVCFGADFDGGGGIDGVEEVTALPNITAALKKAGYSDADLAKIWGGNVLRILGEAARLAQTVPAPHACAVSGFTR
jgi:membrane dipeptidase